MQCLTEQSSLGSRKNFSQRGSHRKISIQVWALVATTGWWNDIVGALAGIVILDAW